MIKKLFSTFTVFALTTIPAHGATPLIEMKDLKIEKINPQTIMVHYANAAVKIESVDGQRFKVNDQVVTISKSQTMDGLEKELQMAYRKGTKKSAALEELFFSKAHAITPLFAALAGGLFGFAMGDAICKNNQPQQQAPAPEYIAPTVTQ